MTSTLPPSTPDVSGWWRGSLLLALFVLLFDLTAHWLLGLDHLVFRTLHALSTPLLVLLAAGASWYTSQQLPATQGQVGWRWIAGGITLIWPALTAWNIALLYGNESPLLPSLLLLFLPVSTLLVIIGLFKLPSGVGTPTEALRLFFDLAIVLLLSGLIMFFYVIVPALEQGSPRGVRLATTFVPMASLLQFFLLWMLLGLQQQQPQRFVTRWLMLGGLFLILSSALFFPAVGRGVQQEHLYS
ncbi:MAG: hypothetical protein H0T73_13900, partial [Ardenticatenales bacterium]|nr:hypothetical protein [Ardenticatenales bacterium]